MISFITLTTFISLQCTLSLSSDGYYRVSQKKLSFTELSICRFATNIVSISYQLAAGFPNAQFGKTQFFFRHPVLFYCKFLANYTHGGNTDSNHSRW